MGRLRWPSVAAAVALLGPHGSGSSPAAPGGPPPWTRVSRARAQALQLDCPSGLSLLPLGPTDTEFWVEVASPSLVSTMFRAECAGRPYPGLDHRNFTIFEAGHQASPLEAKFEVITAPPQIAFVVLLLVDMSGSVVGEGDLAELREAMQAFIDALAPPGEDAPSSLRLSLAAFDGRQHLQRLVSLCRTRGPLIEVTDRMSCGGHLCVDTASSNLYGAVVQGLDQLTRELGAVDAAYEESALVVFTDSRDKAGYSSERDAIDAADASPHSVYTIGLTGDIDEMALRRIGKDGFRVSNNMSAVHRSFAEVGSELRRRQGGFYRIDYCATRRAGVGHNLTVVADGGGAATALFDATGFGPGCIPSVARESALRAAEQGCGAGGDDDVAAVAFMFAGFGVLAALVIVAVGALVWWFRRRRHRRDSAVVGHDQTITSDAWGDESPRTGSPVKQDHETVYLPGQPEGCGASGGGSAAELNATVPGAPAAAEANGEGPSQEPLPPPSGPDGGGADPAAESQPPPPAVPPPPPPPPPPDSQSASPVSDTGGAAAPDPGADAPAAGGAESKGEGEEEETASKSSPDEGAGAPAPPEAARGEQPPTRSGSGSPAGGEVEVDDLPVQVGHPQEPESARGSQSPGPPAAENAAGGASEDAAGAEREEVKI